MEEHNQEVQEASGNSFNAWLQDNLRIIVSVVIVVLIAAGIYSYSNRSEQLSENGVVSEEGVMLEGEEELVQMEGEAGENSEAAMTGGEEGAVPVAISRETESSFVETAKAGDGQTHLARRALANFLEKNPDSALTKEHKIYIEDYLRKNEGFDAPVYVGTSIEFSKDLIRRAIESSKGLNERQLENLKKYSARVTSL